MLLHFIFVTLTLLSYEALRLFYIVRAKEIFIFLNYEVGNSPIISVKINIATSNVSTI